MVHVKRKPGPVGKGLSVLIAGLILGGVFMLGPWAQAGDKADKAEEAEARTQRKQAALDLRMRWTFDKDQPGRIPAGFSALTVGDGPASAWRVEPDAEVLTRSKLVVQGKPCISDSCFQLLIADTLVYDYVEIAFRLRPRHNGAAGIGGVVLGYEDPMNFYAVLADFSEDRLSVVRVQNGVKTVMGSGPVKPKKSPWHHIRVQRNTIISKVFLETYFDARLAVSVEENTLRPGRVGLVTKGDVPIEFDNLDVMRIYSQQPLSGPAAY